jgi:hypothetical protein
LKTVVDVLTGTKKGDPVQLTIRAPQRIGPNYVLRQGTVEVNVR